MEKIFIRLGLAFYFSALLVSCSGDDNASGTEQIGSNNTDLNTFLFLDKKITLSKNKATLFIFDPDTEEMFRGYEIAIDGEFNDQKYKLRLEVYPPDSSPEDSELTFGTFSSGSVCCGGVEFHVIRDDGDLTDDDFFAAKDDTSKNISIIKDGDQFTLTSDIFNVFGATSPSCLGTMQFNYTGPLQLTN
ncbi:hypothetical protein [Aquimarina sp. RZ0]|uniref:hypothetical protein n=1 Tax=Aquimarina sp. RZ0 TaxID=2607730 RepID=UPI0011F3F9D8|nr:hypothetical protein [Aquimarina sp. RZ0]KAA1245389.1 hypothetical protein F0000_12060 [Aquimarina sp. RZ0]